MELIESQLVTHMRRFGNFDSNLFICVTSRLRPDIKDILDLLIFRFVFLADCALESAATLAQLIPIDWQANIRPTPENHIVTNYASSINRLTNFGPHLRNLLKITIRWASVSRDLPGFERGRSLAKRLTPTPPPPNFADTTTGTPPSGTLHAYTEVLRNPPDGRLPRAGSPSEDQVRRKPSRAFTGKYSQQFHAERATSSACECGFSPQTVNHVVFDCPRYDAARAANPRLEFDDRAGRPIKRLHGVLRSAIRIRTLLRF
ncbi:hypothetical protein F5888DRAFT_1859525 [Russula emetica]|nr:hypothetical protein F5888DRAFT_1859525 [Russula emetica]